MFATARILKTSLMFLGVLLLSACSGGSGSSGGGGTDPANTSIARVAITPGSALLTEVGDTQSLTAQAFDASGNPLPATFTWTSSKPEIVTVDGNGKIIAAALGSTQIVAEAAGIRSVSALVAVAMPALGVVMIDDSQVVSAPAVTDPTASFDVGMQYQVTLSGIAPPAIGTLISGNGAHPVAGRVVAVQESGSNVILTLAIVPVAQLFPDLAIDESIDLTHAKIIIPAEVTEHFTVTEHADGSVEYKPKNGDSVTFSGDNDVAPRQIRSASLSPEATPGKKEFKVGPFECEASLTFPLLNITLGALSYEKTLRKDIRHDPVTDAITRLAVVGNIKVEAKSQINIASAAEGVAECNMELGRVPVPLPGPLALLRMQIPFGLGLSAGGKLTIANLGYEAAASAEAALELGLSCPVAGQNCEFLHTVTGKAEGDTKPVLPPLATNLDAALRIEPEFALFAFANLIVKPFNLEQLKAELFAAKAGLKVAADLSTVVGQLADSTYQSDYKLTLESVAKTGKKINSLFNFVQLTVLQAEFKNTVPLSQSPAASAFTIQSSGDAHTFTLDLNPQTITWPMPTTVAGILIPGFLYNVHEIKIFQKQVTVGGVIQPVLVASQIATDNQTHFVLQATAPAASGDFFAFVRTRFLPLPVIGDLEVGGGGGSLLPIWKKMTLPYNKVATWSVYAGTCSESSYLNDDGKAGVDVVCTTQSDRAARFELSKNYRYYMYPSKGFFKLFGRAVDSLGDYFLGFDDGADAGYNNNVTRSGSVYVDAIARRDEVLAPLNGASATCQVNNIALQGKLLIRDGGFWLKKLNEPDMFLTTLPVPTTEVPLVEEYIRTEPGDFSVFNFDTLVADNLKYFGLRISRDGSFGSFTTWSIHGAIAEGVIGWSCGGSGTFRLVGF